MEKYKSSLFHIYICKLLLKLNLHIYMCQPATLITFTEIFSKRALLQEIIFPVSLSFLYLSADHDIYHRTFTGKCTCIHSPCLLNLTAHPSGKSCWGKSSFCGTCQRSKKKPYPLNKDLNTSSLQSNVNVSFLLLCFRLYFMSANSRTSLVPGLGLL